MVSKTVVLLINNPKFFLSHRVTLAKEAQRNGYNVIIAVPKTEGFEKIKSLGFEACPIDINRKGTNPFVEILSIFRLYKTLKKIKPDILHNFTIKPVIYGSIAGQIAGVPSILNTITGLGYVFIKEGIKGILLRAVVSIAYRLAFFLPKVKVAFQNSDDQKLFVDSGWLKRSQSRLIRGSGVDCEKFYASEEPKGPLSILFAARILFDKGITELAEASKILKAKGLEFSLIIAGTNTEGNPADVPLKVLKTWENEGLLKWIGPQKDMPKVIRNSHIVCLPSYREGLPLSLLEALASSRPIVTTDVPGCREVVEDGKNGFLVPVKSTSPLAEALEKLLMSQELRHQFGKCGRKMALDHFSKERILDDTMNLYAELIEESQPNQNLFPKKSA